MNGERFSLARYYTTFDKVIHEMNLLQPFAHRQLRAICPGHRGTIGDRGHPPLDPLEVGLDDMTVVWLEDLQGLVQSRYLHAQVARRRVGKRSRQPFTSLRSRFERSGARQERARKTHLW